MPFDFRSASHSLLPLLVVGVLVATAPRHDGYRDHEAVARPEIALEADLSERKLYVKKGGEVVKTYPIAIGLPSHPTPRGRFSIRKIIWNPRWVPPPRDWAKGLDARGPGDPDNPMQVAKIFFREPYYYIHGTNAPGSIGKAASHGCIRLRKSDVAELGEFLMEHAGEPRSKSWYDRVFKKKVQEVVLLEQAVPLVIHD